MRQLDKQLVGYEQFKKNSQYYVQVGSSISELMNSVQIKKRLQRNLTRFIR